ncbi:uncharacterized protein LOC116139107 [Pistacia vera]|uniref:uncharacterized protein LOC116139107 n=1 Tax=Pistacia vera TaxID=55513 RepID=UPI0012638AD9|nr:uncharacterized protein LOC116139107 [Pistacia vera]
MSTVKEYSVRFNSLARFAPGIVSTPELRREKFVYGLRPEIARDIMTGAEPPHTYTEALERALRAEIYVNKMSLEGPSMKVQNEPSPTPQKEIVEVVRGRDMRNKKRFQPKKNRGDWQSKRPRTAGVTPCPKCEKYHLGECLKEFGPNVCYRCCQPRHLMRDCKTPPPPTAQASRGTNARVFTMAQGEVEASPSAVTGQLFFHVVPLYALIDSGATHSFLSHGMIERLGLKSVVVDQPIRIELPDGGSME